MTSTHKPRILFLAFLAVGLAAAVSGCGGDDDDDTADGDGDADADSDSDADADADSDADSDSDSDGDGDADGDGDGDADADGDADPNAPSITITILEEAIHAGDSITVSIAVENFVLEEPVGQGNEDGHGHYHIYLDDDVGGDYLIAGAAAENQVDLPRNLSVGAHSLRANLTANDHRPFNPSIEGTADFTVE